MSYKVVIIGLDGATFDVIKPLAKRGWLPTISTLLREGGYGELFSTIQPITPQAWSTFLTGKNAGKHGIFSFIRRRVGSYDVEFVNAGSRTGESIFLYLSNLGLNVGAIGVPFTYPPEPVNGFMLSGFDAPAEDERSVYPSELFQEVRKNFGHYYIHLASPVGRTDNEERFWRDIQEEDKNRTDISLYLMENFSCDLFMTTYYNTDRVQHQYLSYDFLRSINSEENGEVENNLITRTYRNLDREIGRLLEKVDDETLVLLISDHGSGPIKKVFFLNRWLEERGFLTYKKSTGIGMNVVERAREAAKRFLPRKIKGVIKGTLHQIRNRVESFRYFSEIDWENTKAYGCGMYGNVCINLKGREPHGTVKNEDFDRLCREISDQLLSLTDMETGERPVEKVYRREELYSGKLTSYAPDMIIKWRDYSYYTPMGRGREEGPFFGGNIKIDSSDFDHIGTHRLNGVLIAWGKGVKKGLFKEKAFIQDLAPTILYALNQPIPMDMDGKVLSGIFSPSFNGGKPPIFVKINGERTPFQKDESNYTRDEARSVEERLRGLGYL